MDETTEKIELLECIVQRLLSGDWYASIGSGITGVYTNQWVPVFENDDGVMQRNFDAEPEDFTAEELEILTRLQRFVASRERR